MESKYGFNTTPARSQLMSKIKSVNTKPELLLRKALWKEGYRYRLNVSKLPGKPDIVFNKMKLVVFIDGEFWHGYMWHEKREKIKSNHDYWIKKIEGNIKRDKKNTETILSMGYTVIRFWEHEIKNDLIGCVAKVKKHITRN